MKLRIAFIKSNQVKNWSGYVGTYDREIVFASESLAKIINDLGLEKVPIDVYLKDSRKRSGGFGGFIAFPEKDTFYTDFGPKTEFGNQRFTSFVDSQNFCICLNELSYRLSQSLKRFGQRLSPYLVIDKIHTIYPIEAVNFYLSYRNHNDYIYTEDLDKMKSDNRYNLITLKRSEKKTDLDAPICREIYKFADSSATGGLLVLTGDGDYSFAIEHWLDKIPSRIAASAAIMKTISPELYELNNHEQFDMIQLGADLALLNGCWVPDTRDRN